MYAEVPLWFPNRHGNGPPGNEATPVDPRRQAIVVLDAAVPVDVQREIV
jgi:hypothetical protein